MPMPGIGAFEVVDFAGELVLGFHIAFRVGADDVH